MRPGELKECVGQNPIAWIPYGTLEWHGRHLPTGLDALKAHKICLKASEKAGGVVLPPNFNSMKGTFFPWTFRYPASLTIRNLYTTLEFLHRYGFRVMIILTGHYPAEQIILFEACAQLFTAVHDSIAIAGPEFFFASEIGYFGDHAAKWETSIMMHLFPELIDGEELSKLGRFTESGLFFKGVFGENPATEASPELGKKAVDLIVDNMAELAGRLSIEKNKKAALDFHIDCLRGYFGNNTETAKRYLRIFSPNLSRNPTHL